MRRRLRDQFDITLPRFDLMAQLDSAPNGMTLGELSQRMMVSNGNVTGLVERLGRAGPDPPPAAPNDRRVQIVSLTAEGQQFFRSHGAGNADWVAEIFADLAPKRHRGADAAAGQDQGVGAQGAWQRRRAMSAANPVTLPLSAYKAQHVDFAVDGKVATLTLNRPDKKNPLTFESYAEIVDMFRAAAQGQGVKAFVITGAGGNFCSGGDVFEIIGPLVEMDTVELLDFTRMTGELVKAMRACAAADRRRDRRRLRRRRRDPRHGLGHAHRHRRAKVAFLFNRVGLAGCDMGACAILPRIIGQGRAAELLYTGRVMGGEEAERWGFFNRLVSVRDRAGRGADAGARPRRGPTFANAMTKRMLEMEWAMSVETAIEAEAVAQALCMETEDFARAFRAFAAKQKPVFEGN